MKILLASSNLDIKNGYGNFTYEYVTALMQAGHEITLLLPADDKNKKYDIKGVVVKRILPPHIFRLKSRKILKYLFWKFPQTNQFDLVHSLFAFPYAPLLCREARRYKKPFIMGAQGTYGVQPLSQWPEKYFLRYAYKHANSIIVPSQYTKNAILKESGKEFDIDIVHNGVNYDRFALHKPTQSNLVDSFGDKKVLLTVGELKSRKGQDLVIKALPKIVKEYPKIIYVMAGYPSWKKHLIDLANKLGVQDYILITGAVSDEEILNLFHRADIYVHTTRVHNRFQFEGFGMVYLEAGACGKPSIGTDAGGIREALVHGKTGFIASDGDFNQVADYVNRLLLDSELRNEFGKSALEYAKNHDWPLIAAKYIKKYNEVIGYSISKYN